MLLYIPGEFVQGIMYVRGYTAWYKPCACACSLVYYGLGMCKLLADGAI